MYTTGERLLTAEELNDLIVQSEERELLWQALRERGLRSRKARLHRCIRQARGHKTP